MTIDVLTVMLNGLLLTICFYIFSKFGFGKEMLFFMMIVEIMPFLQMISVIFSYFNAALYDQLTLIEINTFIYQVTYIGTKNAIESILANIGALFATLLLTIIEKLS